MFGYNVGVTMAYEDVVLELSKGIQAYKAPIKRCIEIMPYQDGSFCFDAEDRGVLYEGEVYRAAMERQVFSDNAMDVLCGSDVGMSVPEVSEAQSVMSVPSAVLAHDVPQLQNVDSVPIKNAVPDIEGMTLKGQAQTIISWAGGGMMSEEVLVKTFGKKAIKKLADEGYLIRTKKGILPGS